MQNAPAPKGTLWVLFCPITSKVEKVTVDPIFVRDYIKDPLLTDPLGVEVYRDGQLVKTRLFHVRPQQLN